MATEYLNNKAFERIINSFQGSKKAKAKFELIIEDLSDTIHRKSSRKINIRKEKQLLNQYTSACQEVYSEHRDSQENLAAAFYTLSENIVRYAKFNLIDTDDATQEGVMICFEKIDRFDPRKGKAFNYMTTCILNHFRQLYRTARNYNELKKKYHDFLQLRMTDVIIKNGKQVSDYHSSLTKRHKKNF